MTTLQAVAYALGWTWLVVACIIGTGLVLYVLLAISAKLRV